jgi:hypothetical protein
VRPVRPVRAVSRALWWPPRHVAPRYAPAVSAHAVAVGAYVVALVLAVVVVGTRRRRAGGLTIAIIVLFGLVGLALGVTAPADWWAGGRTH